MTKLAMALAAVALLGSSSAAKLTHLTIDVWPSGRTVAAGHEHFILRCAPARGTVAHPGTSCAALARLAKPFAPTPAGVACPSLVLGPQEAHVVGTVRGVKVNAWLNLVHCGIAQWGRVKAIVPEPYHPVSAPKPAPPSSPTTGAIPTIAGFSPASGPVGTEVTVAGTNLAGVVGVQIGHVIQTPESESDTQVLFLVPQGAETGQIKVLTKGGAATSAGSFTVTG